MGTITYSDYVAARASDVVPRCAVAAVHVLREVPRALDLDWERDGTHTHLVGGAHTPAGRWMAVIFRLKPDEDADLSYLGAWSDRPHGDYVDQKQLAAHGQLAWSNREFRYWIAPETRASLFAWYQKAGVDRHTAWVAACQDFWQMYREAKKERSIYGLICEVYVVAADREVTLGDASCWGIDLTYSRWQDAVAYVNTVAAELLSEALANADANAAALGLPQGEV